MYLSSKIVIFPIPGPRVWVLGQGQNWCKVKMPLIIKNCLLYFFCVLWINIYRWFWIACIPIPNLWNFPTLGVQAQGQHYINKESDDIVIPSSLLLCIVTKYCMHGFEDSGIHNPSTSYWSSREQQSYTGSENTVHDYLKLYVYSCTLIKLNLEN